MTSLEPHQDDASHPPSALEIIQDPLNAMQSLIDTALHTVINEQLAQYPPTLRNLVIQSMKERLAFDYPLVYRIHPQQSYSKLPFKQFLEIDDQIEFIETLLSKMELYDDANANKFSTPAKFSAPTKKIEQYFQEALRYFLNTLLASENLLNESDANTLKTHYFDEEDQAYLQDHQVILKNYFLIMKALHIILDIKCRIGTLRQDVHSNYLKLLQNVDLEQLATDHHPQDIKLKEACAQLLLSKNPQQNPQQNPQIPSQLFTWKEWYSEHSQEIISLVTRYFQLQSSDDHKAFQVIWNDNQQALTSLITQTSEDINPIYAEDEIKLPE